MATELEKTAEAKVNAFGMGVALYATQLQKQLNVSPDAFIKAAAEKYEIFKGATAADLHERIIDWVDQSLPATEAQGQA